MTIIEMDEYIMANLIRVRLLTGIYRDAMLKALHLESIAKDLRDIGMDDLSLHDHSITLQYFILDQSQKNS